jgi:hypothetical protein
MYNLYSLINNKKMEKYSKNIFFISKGKPIEISVPSFQPTTKESQKGKIEKALKAAKGHEAQKYKLVRKYIFRNNPKNNIEGAKASPKWVAFRDILLNMKSKSKAIEAYLMLALIEKYWGIDEAWKQLKHCRNNPSYYHIPKLRAFFKENKVAKELGFYYGTNWRDSEWVGDNRKALKIKRGVWRWNKKKTPFHDADKSKLTGGKRKWAITGWWTVDNTPGHLHEFSFSHSLKGALSKIRYELIKDPGDSGLSDKYKTRRKGKDVNLRAEQIVALLEKSKGEADVYASDVSVKVMKYFKDSKDHNKKWDVLRNSEIAGKAAFHFNQNDIENYLFYYSHEKKKIYFVSIAGKYKWSKFGYIPIEKIEGREQLGKWTDKSSDINFLKKEIVDDMPKSKIEKEIQQPGVLESTETLTIDKLLTQPSLLKKYKVPLTFLYENTKLYFRSLKEGYKKYLKDNTHEKEKEIEAKAAAAVSKAETGMHAFLNDDSNKWMKDVIKPKSRLELKISSTGTVTVNFKDKLTQDAAKNAKKAITKAKAAEAAKIAKESNPVTKTLSKLKKKINDFVEDKLRRYVRNNPRFQKYEKYIAMASKTITDMISEIANLPGTVKEIFASKNPAIRSALLGLVGGGAIAAGLVLRKKGLSRKTFEEHVRKTSRYTFRRKHKKLPEEIDLKRGKIVIKNGKDFEPIAGMKVKIKGGATEIVPADKGKWGKYKGKEITIVGKLPKGFVVKRGFEWRK